MGLSAIDCTISWLTMPPTERPTKTSAPSMASARSPPSPSGLANSALNSLTSRSSVMMPEESHIVMFSRWTPSET